MVAPSLSSFDERPRRRSIGLVRLSSRVAVTLLVVVAVLVGAGAHGYAEPTPAELEAQIDEEWNKLEPIIEQYNLVHNQLKENQGKADALQRQQA